MSTHDRDASRVRLELPTGTVTFLFTDVEGSTRLLHELGAERYAAALADHRRLIREACASEGGVEVDTQGDAFFFAFPSAPGALAAATSTYRRPRLRPDPRPRRIAHRRPPRHLRGLRRRRRPLRCAGRRYLARRARSCSPLRPPPSSTGASPRSALTDSRTSTNPSRSISSARAPSPRSRRSRTRTCRPPPRASSVETMSCMPAGSLLERDTHAHDLGPRRPGEDPLRARAREESARGALQRLRGRCLRVFSRVAPRSIARPCHDLPDPFRHGATGPECARGAHRPPAGKEAPAATRQRGARPRRRFRALAAPTGGGGSHLPRHLQRAPAHRRRD